MNTTSIDWCDMSWNPVTGCLHGCDYCYARGIAHRFCGHYFGSDTGTNRVLHEKARRIKTDDSGQASAGKVEPFPYGFDPTFHRYRLEEPQHTKKPQNIFVCSMADLFGRWVPVQWIRDVVDTCAAAPWHRYMFLTKNPARYLELDKIALLPYGEHFWYGSTVSDEDSVAMYPYHPNIRTFWSMEPLLGPVNLLKETVGTPNWVIIGAETGKRKGKVIPCREWVDDIASVCADRGIPVFYKDSIRKLFRDLPESQFPWQS